MSNSNVVDLPMRNQRLHAIANAADMPIMLDDSGTYEVHWPDVGLDQQAVVEVAQALSRLKMRQIQTIDILADELLGRDKSSEVAH